ncbi:unnamed protein product, partial [Discosporangium mesarthrocarpum]
LLPSQAALLINKAFNRLVSIDVSGTGISDNGLPLILGASKTIRSLGLRRLQGLTDRGLGAILQSIKHWRCLRTLDLRWSIHFTNDGLLALLAAGGILQSVRFQGCSQLSELFLTGFERAVFTTTCLLHLDLTGLGIADIGLCWLPAPSCLLSLKGCKLLERLNLSCCRLITDLGLEYLSNGSGEKALPLKSLSLAGVLGVTDIGMALLLPRSGVTLQELTLNGATALGDSTVRCISCYCPNMLSLGLVELTRTSDGSLAELGKGCRKLRCLDLSSNINILEATHRTRVPSLGSRGVKELCRYAVSLTALHLNGACKVADAALMAIGSNCNKLEELSLRWHCSLVTDAGLKAVILSGASLRHLNIGGCINVTDVSIKALAEHCGRSLRSLDVMSCWRVTDISLHALGLHCPNMEAVNLQNCEWISDKGCLAMLRGCRSLTTLNLKGAADLTEAVIAAIEACCRHLHQLNVTNIPQISGTRVEEAGRRLPLAARLPRTRELRPCPRACQVFNTHVQERVEWTATAIAAQRICRGFLARRKLIHYATRLRWASTVLSDKLGAAWLRRMRRENLRVWRAREGAARRLQSSWRAYVLRSEAKRELGRRIRERGAATCMQRVSRGRQGRQKAKRRRNQIGKVIRNWEWFCKRLQRREHAFRNWYTATSLAVSYNALWRMRRRQRCFHAAIKIQSCWRRYLALAEWRRLYAKAFDKRVDAAYRIQAAWRYQYRLKWLLRDVRLREQAVIRRNFNREYAQLKIRAWWMNVKSLSFKRASLQGVILARKSAKVIQVSSELRRHSKPRRNYRSYSSRTFVRRLRQRKVMRRCWWRRFYLGIKRLPRGEHAIKIQMLARRYRRRRKRFKAAVNIQRVFRGLLARQVCAFTVKLARWYTVNAVNIQRVVRGHLVRLGEVRDRLREHHSALVITRAMRTYARNLAFKAMVKDALNRKAQFERLQREAAVRKRAENIVKLRFHRNREKAATALQA